MAYCVRCGAKVDDTVHTCPQCGSVIPTVEGTYGTCNGQQTQDQKEKFNPYEEYRQNGNGYQQNGNAYQEGNTYQQNGYTYQQNRVEYFHPEDVKRNKAMGVLAYLGFLVLVPVIGRDKSSEYAAFHTNQGLILWITGVIANLLTGGSFFGFHSLLHFDWWLSDVIGVIIGIGVFVLSIMGIVNACRGEKQELPIIGKLRIIR